MYITWRYFDDLISWLISLKLTAEVSVFSQLLLPYIRVTLRTVQSYWSRQFSVVLSSLRISFHYDRYQIEDFISEFIIFLHVSEIRPPRSLRSKEKAIWLLNY